MLRRSDIQFDFPVYAPPDAPAWLRPLWAVLSALAPYLKYLLWAGLAATAALVLYLVGREIVARRFARRRPDRLRAGKGVAPPSVAGSRALLEAADQLAADGRFSEAAHLLLHRTIKELAGRDPAFVRPALTSRDIAAMDALPSRARGAFAEIAKAVERGFFAGRDLDAAEFAACRRAYGAFADAESWA